MWTRDLGLSLGFGTRCEEREGVAEKGHGGRRIGVAQLAWGISYTYLFIETTN